MLPVPSRQRSSPRDPAAVFRATLERIDQKTDAIVVPLHGGDVEPAPSLPSGPQAGPGGLDPPIKSQGGVLRSCPSAEILRLQQELEAVTLRWRAALDQVIASCRIADQQRAELARLDAELAVVRAGLAAWRRRRVLPGVVAGSAAFMAWTALWQMLG